jgi:hypothetical protein
MRETSRFLRFFTANSSDVHRQLRTSQWQIDLRGPSGFFPDENGNNPLRGLSCTQGIVATLYSKGKKREDQ